MYFQKSLLQRQRGEAPWLAANSTAHNTCRLSTLKKNVYSCILSFWKGQKENLLSDGEESIHLPKAACILSRMHAPSLQEGLLLQVSQ